MAWEQRHSRADPAARWRALLVVPPLIVPMGLLHGPAAALALSCRLALPLAGGPAAFSLARLADGAVVPATALQAGPALDLLCAPRPRWAALSGSPPWVMGILNVTPDSFSDGGHHADPAAAIAAGMAMAAAGADLVDIGGESTRPGSRALEPAEEQCRILPVIAALARAGVAVSVDTRHAATMRAALDAGARVVNDISALAHDPESAGVVAAARAPVVLMHMRGTPQTMGTHASYGDIVAEVTGELASRLIAAEVAGIARADIAVDPGIGFAKNAPDNIALLAGFAGLHILGCHVLAGVSRKRFIGHLTGETEPARRGPGSLAAALAALDHGATILRVHDVAETVQAVRVWRGLHTS